MARADDAARERELELRRGGFTNMREHLGERNGGDELIQRRSNRKGALRITNDKLSV